MRLAVSARGASCLVLGEYLVAGAWSRQALMVGGAGLQPCLATLKGCATGECIFDTIFIAHEP